MRSVPYSDIALIITFVAAILIIFLDNNYAYIFFTFLLIIVGVIQIVAFSRKRKIKGE